MKDRLVGRNDLLTWKWTKGGATLRVDFGDPTATTSYALCVYDATGGSPALVAQVDVPAGGASCAGRPCWRATKRGFKYVDRSGARDGVTWLLLREGFDGAAYVTLEAAGANLPMPALPLVDDPRMVVQLRNDLGRCWGAEFSAPAVRNAAEEFRDKSD
jgi:hypothetical protein